MSYENTISHWQTPEDVDWNLVRATLAAYLREVVTTFRRKNPEAVVYGMVLKSGQNRELSVYLNTEDGYRTMPGRFRKEFARTYGDATDEELLANLGRWFFEQWEFDLYEFQCEPEVSAIHNLHYELFERLSEADGDVSDMDERFLAACARAMVMLEASDELEALRRTEDFEIRLFDGNTYEWETQAVLAQARREISGG